MHFGARFYLPKLGRFASADTIVPNFANPQALNRYAFVLNNPLRYTDPTGHTSACANAAIADPECSAPSNDPVTYSNVYTGTGLEPEEVVFNNSSGGGTSVGGGDFCSQNPVACQFESDGGGDPVIQGPPASAPVTYLNTEGRLKDDGPRARFVNPFDDYYDPICPFTIRQTCAGGYSKDTFPRSSDTRWVCGGPVDSSIGNALCWAVPSHVGLRGQIEIGGFTPWLAGGTGGPGGQIVLNLHSGEIIVTTDFTILGAVGAPASGSAAADVGVLVGWGSSGASSLVSGNSFSTGVSGYSGIGMSAGSSTSLAIDQGSGLPPTTFYVGGGVGTTGGSLGAGGSTILWSQVIPLD